MKAGEAKPTTLRSYRAHVDNVIVPAIGHVPIERLRAEHIEQLLIDAAAGRGPVTVRRIGWARSPSLIPSCSPVCLT